MRSNRFYVLFTVMVIQIFTGTCSVSSANPNTDRVSVTAYHIQFEPDFDSGYLAARARLTIENHSGQKAFEIPFVLNRSLKVTAVYDSSGRELAFNQHIAAFEENADLEINRILIQPDLPMNPGTQTDVVFYYHGKLMDYTHAGYLYIRDRIDPSYTILREDAFAYPQSGNPSYKSMMASGMPQFDYTVQITVPETLVVANIGEQFCREQLSDDRVLYCFRNIKTAWRMDFAISSYKTLQAEGLKVYYFSGEKKGANRVMNALVQTKEMYTEWFGPLINPAASFTVIQVPEGWGSQADVTGILQTSDAFTDPASLRALYHELSHLWNVRPLETSPPRWEEGLAVYLENRVASMEPDGLAMDKWAHQLSEHLQTRINTDERLRNIPMIDYGEARLTNYSYSAGALMFYELAKAIGTDNLDHLIGEFYRKYYQTGGSTEDFAVLLKEAGDTQVSSILEKWLYTTNWTKTLDGLK